MVIKVGDIEISRTTVVHDNANPLWYEECFEFPPSHFDFNKVEFTLEVWDMDMTEVGSFLGQATFAGKDFAQSAEVITVTKKLKESTFHDGGVPGVPTTRPEMSFFQRMASENDPAAFGFTGIAKVQDEEESEELLAEEGDGADIENQKGASNTKKSGLEQWEKLRGKGESSDSVRNEATNCRLLVVANTILHSSQSPGTGSSETFTRCRTRTLPGGRKSPRWCTASSRRRHGRGTSLSESSSRTSS